uniref:Hexosyltransferase n=1 Tax=Elaeophora elaphi TaxID=1147741 RepID=A0A0R3RTJ7_9BILA
MRRLKRAILRRTQFVNVCCVVIIFSSLILLLHIFTSFSSHLKRAREATETIFLPYNFTEARILLTPSFQQCPNVPVFYIIRTHPRNTRWRSIIRSTWAGSLKHSLVFVLGVEKIGEVNEIVKLEAKKYDDLIVFDMIDSYNNMTLKSLNILNWIVQNCQAPRFFMQGDPDIAAFPDEITSYTSKLDVSSIAVYGKCWKGAKAHREDSSKWALNSLVYASATYPTYLAGGAWLFSPTTAKRLLMALEKPFSYVHIDDMLISGLFAELMDIRRVCLETIGYLHEFSLEKCGNDHILAILQLEEHEILNTLLDYREASIQCYTVHSSYR